MSDRNKNQQQNQNQQQQQEQNKGKGKPPMRVPLVGSIRTGVRYLLTMADEALLAAVFILPIWGVCAALKISEVTLPTNFGVLWTIAFFMFLLQNNLFRR